jgi:hypothetical protein
VLLFLLVCESPTGAHGGATKLDEDPLSHLFLGSSHLSELNAQLQEVLDWGVENGVITEEQRSQLLDHLNQHTTCSFNGKYSNSVH